MIRSKGALQRNLKRYSSLHLRLSALVLVLVCLLPGIVEGKAKKDKFRGTVVYAGPKAISVRGQDSLYLVRTFNYSSAAEKRIQAKRPAPGARVTIHYLRGTNQAVKVD